MIRTPEFAEESLAFVQEVNTMVTRLIGGFGSTRNIPESESDPKVEAAAIMLTANLLAVVEGNFEALSNDVWPRAARGNIAQFEAAASQARRMSGDAHG